MWDWWMKRVKKRKYFFERIAWLKRSLWDWQISIVFFFLGGGEFEVDVWWGFWGSVEVVIDLEIRRKDENEWNLWMFSMKKARWARVEKRWMNVEWRQNESIDSTQRVGRFYWDYHHRKWGVRFHSRRSQMNELRMQTQATTEGVSDVWCRERFHQSRGEVAALAIRKKKTGCPCRHVMSVWMSMWKGFQSLLTGSFTSDKATEFARS
jgi:hypothetical protein